MEGGPSETFRLADALAEEDAPVHAEDMVAKGVAVRTAAAAVGAGGGRHVSIGSRWILDGSRGDPVAQAPTPHRRAPAFPPTLAHHGSLRPKPAAQPWMMLYYSSSTQTLCVLSPLTHARLSRRLLWKAQNGPTFLL
ncbi:uncharacterized protein VTP21DRAFT_7195 [Calcarisporiella thermophila]|uniref:uncharacterized protein n=1 Tax=Calcarisporiella thermophila TaxID=911321 RepID=UPI00374401BF